MGVNTNIKLKNKIYLQDNNAYFAPNSKRKI